jgi:putative ABC transport system permease protein
MFRFYVADAWRQMRARPVLMSLVVLTLAVGVAAALIASTLVRAASHQPVAHKINDLYLVRFNGSKEVGDQSYFPEMIIHRDALAIQKLPPVRAFMHSYATGMIGRAAGTTQNVEQLSARATGRDFFAMFDVPFAYGAPWSKEADQSGEPVVVVSHETNQKLFGGGNSVGKALQAEGRQFQVVGVLKPFVMRPRLYDLTTTTFGDVEQLYLPFRFAIQNEMPTWGNNNCEDAPGEGFAGRLATCYWQQLWVQVDGQAGRQALQKAIDAYSQQLRADGVISRAPHFEIQAIDALLDQNGVVPDDYRMAWVVSLGFLLVCILNASGLLLAKGLGRTKQLAILRAVGESRTGLIWQGCAEALPIGLLGGGLGLALGELGLFLCRKSFDHESAKLAVMDASMIALAIAAALIGALAACLYPALRTANLNPAQYLRGA